MDWMISVSADEGARGLMQPETAAAVHRALRVHGVALLQQAFSEDVMGTLHQEFLHRYGGLDDRQMADRASAPAPNPFVNVGEMRWDITPRIDGALADPAVFANPLLRNFLPLLLGGDSRLSAFTIVTSFPGATMQETHRDSRPLFPETRSGDQVPAYAIIVSVPLVDVDLEMGPTGFWLGSHLWPADRAGDLDTVTGIPSRRGDCVLYDYRTLHAGLANQSQQVRPLLYMAYTRRWFYDEVNYENRIALDMPLDTYLALPEAVRPMLFWVFSEAMRSKYVSRSVPR
jgi:ectoine hydroxylase-related dioxygenase (phytanoyl-CoA dioxygenase family)